MPDSASSIMTGIHMVDQVLVVQAPNTFDDESLREMRRCVLERAYALGARGVILDVSALRVLDSVSYGLLADTARTLGMLGAKTIFSGFQPGVVAALIEFDVDSTGLHAVTDVATGLALLRPEPESEDEDETRDESETRDDDDTEHPEQDEAQDKDADEDRTEEEDVPDDDAEQY